MRREWAGTSGSARAGRERTDTYIVSTTPSTKRRETDRRGWKRKKKEGGSQIVTASYCGGGSPRNPLLETNSWAGFPSQKKKGKKTHAASVRPGRRLLIIPPPTNNVCAPHTSWSPYRVEKKQKNKNNFCPVIHAENVGHTRLPQLTVLIREKRRATGNSRRFHFVRVLCSCRGNKKIIISPGSFVSIRPAENLKEMLFSSWLRPESTINHIVPCCLSHPIFIRINDTSRTLSRSQWLSLSFVQEHLSRTGSIDKKKDYLFIGFVYCLTCDWQTFSFFLSRILFDLVKRISLLLRDLPMRWRTLDSFHIWGFQIY